MSSSASKSISRRRHTGEDKRSPDTSDRRDIFIIILTVILAGLFFGLGKYFEFNTPGPFDSGAYVYSAAHILNGAKIGVEEKPSARIGTLLVNILGVWLFGYNEFGPELIQAILQATALVLMFIAMRRLYCTAAAALGTIIASFYLSAPLIAKFGNVKEQYMIACMVIAISCFILAQLGNKQLWLILTGAFASWAPLFKPTGMSVIGALGIFILLQPLLKNKTIKQTAMDILFIFIGVVLAIGPLYIWILGWDVQLELPYIFVWQVLAKLIPTSTDAASQGGLGYVTSSRRLVPFSQQWPRVLRYYSLLILPISISVASIIVRLWRLWNKHGTKSYIPPRYDRFVLLLALWWILDMAFVWVSPRSYEQYYLPLTASGAMLGSYIVAVYFDRLKATKDKIKWRLIGMAGLFVMIFMAWNVFFGIEKSPYSGRSYGQRTKGYVQTFKDVSYRRRNNLRGPWEIVAEYIKQHSKPDDKIYVWGWYPGIYVQAQRFSSASKACCMPRPAPHIFERVINDLLAEFEKQPPKFIVDSRKRHIPTERPPYELWPIVPKGFMKFEKSTFLPNNKDTVELFDRIWAELLKQNFDEDEARRYEILKPLRQFVMTRYRIVGMFGEHVLFELKEPTGAAQK